MSILNKPIDYKILEQELHEALRADELYKLQNDAKIRAIEQAVPTYDDFKEMVNGAHLKSLDRKDMTPKIGVKWNSIASDKSSQCYNKNLKIHQQKVKEISSNTTPRNAHEFQQIWKRIVDYREKFRLLNTSRLALRSKIFRSEIPPEILHECICVCLENLKTHENSSSIIDILTTLSRCNRFHLAIAFMSDGEKKVSKQLFELLRSGSCAENEDFEMINSLEKMYVVETS